MDFFSRTSFPAREQFVGQRQVELGCAECQALKRKAAMEELQASEEELSCSKCKRKKKKTPPSLLVPAYEAPSDMEPLAGRMGQAAPMTATIPVAAPPPAGVSPWLLGAGLLGLLGIGVLATNS